MKTTEPFPVVSTTRSQSLRKIFSHLIPVVLLLLLYGPALRGWFQQDDFAWLYMSRWMPEGSGWLYHLFTPQAQGTIRPLGDRLFFTVLGGLFGRNAIPFHVAALATQCISILLWVRIAARLTGNHLAGILAAALWILNSALVAPMVWIAAYNEVLWAGLLLLALTFKLKYLETGLKRYLLLEWTAFLLGFGAIELNVVYPLLGAAYLMIFRSKGWRIVAWQMGVAVTYTAVHMLAAPVDNTGPYAVRVDARILATFAEYWKISLGPSESARWFPWFAPWATAATALLSLAGVVVIAIGIRRHYPAVVFGAVWFVIGLAPVLILPGHVSSYYLFVPVMGLSLCAAQMMFVCRAGWPRSIAIAMLTLYALTNAGAAISTRDWTIARTLRVRRLYDALEQIRARGVVPCILLRGMNDDEFWGGYYAMRRFVPDLQNVYLTPGAEREITSTMDTFGTVADYTMPPIRARESLRTGSCAAFDLRQTPPRDVSQEELAKLRMQ